MGASVLNTLTELRTQVKDVLTTAGLKASDYVPETISPPIALVIPAEPYVTLGEGRNPFGHYSVGIHVLLIGPKGTNKTAAEKVDSMILDTMSALEDWEITEVTQPGEVVLKGIAYMGSVVTLTQNIKLIKEVI